MAQQTINVGAAPNDGTGTPLRTAFQYTNSNFSELYAALGGGSGLPGSANQVLFNNGTSIAGDAGMTYNPSTDTMTLVNLVLSGTFAAPNGSVPSSIRSAANNLTAVAFDGVTSDSRVTSTLTGQNVGTGDFSVWSRFRVPASTSSQIRPMLALSSSASSPSQAESVHLFIAATGELSFRLLGATTSDLRNANVSGFLAAYTGQVVDVVVTRTGTTVKIYINGVDTAFTETTGGTPPAWSATVTSTFCNVGLGLGGGIYNERIYRTAVFNRALASSEVSSLILLGVSPGDQWGTQNVVFNATFAGTTDGFSANGAGVSVASVSNQLEVTSTTPNGGGTLRGSVLASGKNFRISFKARLQSGDCIGTVRSGTTQCNTIGATTTLGFTPTSTLTQYSFEFNNPGDPTLYLRLFNTINPSVVELDDIVLTRIGAFIDLDFTVGGGRIAYDRSTNNLHGVLFGGAAWSSPTNAPDSQSAIRAAASDYAAVMFDGTTASTRVVSGCQSLGTGDFSVWNRIRVPMTNPTASAGVFFLSDTDNSANRANAFVVYLTSAGALQIQRYGATTADNRLATINNFRNGYSGQVVDIVVTRSGTTLKVYVNGVDTPYSESTAGSAPPWSDTIVSSFYGVGCISGASNTIFTGRIFRSVVFNRALSAADVTEVITTGVNPADQWGSTSSVYSSNFTAGVDSFSSYIGGTVTLTGNETAPDATTGWLKAVRAAAGTGRMDISRGSVLPALAKRYRATASIYNVDCGTQFFGIQADQAVIVTDTQQVSNGTSATVTQEFVSTSTSTLRIGPMSAASIAFVSALVPNGATYYVKNITVVRVGAIVDLDFTVGCGYQAHDRSTNALHGTLFNGVEFSIPKRVAVLYATTNTNGNQQMLGTLAIPTNAIIEDIIVNSTGTATVSIGNASAGTQIVNGASVVAGRQKLTLATPFSTTGNLWVNSNSTATLQFTILYTIAS